MWQFQVDVGGTFTDWIAQGPDRSTRFGKVLSSGTARGSEVEWLPGGELRIPDLARDPDGFWIGYELRLLDRAGTTVQAAGVAESDSGSGRVRFHGPLPSVEPGSIASWELCSPEPSPLFAIRQVLGLGLAEPLPPVELRLGTTRGTNALLTRSGARTAFVTTRGFGDLLRIGQQDRPHLFELTVRRPEPLFELSLEIDERISADGTVLKAPDPGQVREQFRALRAVGIGSLGICLLHGFRFGDHERRLGAIAREVGFGEISLSCEVAPLIRMVPRGETTVLDAFLNPVIRSYCDRIMAALGPQSRLQLMTSAGTLVGREAFTGKDSVLSGPAGGVVGFARAARAAGFGRAIGFDMGGTSTDVARYGGTFEREYETRKAGVRIVTPVMAIETVAAGGGSICAFDGVRLTVGPGSAGASPGPACYGAGGPLTVTDLNLLLGRICPAQFPFPLDRRAAERRLDELRERVGAESGHPWSAEELAAGLLEIANHVMAAAARTVSVQKGYDPREHVLVAFGGAGPQHATAVATRLGTPRVLVHPLCSLLSAVGIGQSERACNRVETVLEPFAAAGPRLEEIFQRIESQACEELVDSGRRVPDGKTGTQRHLDLRYAGTEPAITVRSPEDRDWMRAFSEAHRQLYGYVRDLPVEVVAARVEATLAADENRESQLHAIDWTAANPGPVAGTAAAADAGCLSATAWFHDAGGKLVERSVPQLDWTALAPGKQLAGPLLVASPTTTVVVEPEWKMTVLADRQLLLERGEACQTAGQRARGTPDVSRNPADPVRIEIFNQQFAAIARQMGITLQRTAISVNIRDRLDFSCAVFSAAGRLVVNAPHIPVHLGSMGEAVRGVIAMNPEVREGDVFVTNHPWRGGSHLPDITVVTPVFTRCGTRLAGKKPGRPDFWVASRGHHAEIGGRTPGSMPPDARSLADEGVLLDNITAVAAGIERLDRVEKILCGGRWPSRSPQDNLADLRAQIAANQMGGRELQRLVEENTLPVVQQMMEEIRMAARQLVERRLASIPDGNHCFSDQMDSGARIQVAVQKQGQRLRIDFAGTDPVQPDNLNANRGIVAAATMYVLRCLLDQDIPLNDGILEPVEIVIPENCFLNPDPGPDAEHCPAIVGGNVETSQRVVDVLLGALGLAAASQGTMNNWLMGGAGFGYYETLGGGSGATADGPGTDAVHTHMSNTRLTDPEVLETRYPVRLTECAIRRGSGGAGRHRGGNGMIRSIEFLQPLTVSLLTSRRLTQPYGLEGGEAGSAGVNRLVRADGRVELLEFRTAVDVQPGDRLTLETPGGGGWGSPVPPL